MLVEQAREMPCADTEPSRKHFNRCIIERARIDQADSTFDRRQ
jgi:hypothetical protein